MLHPFRGTRQRRESTFPDQFPVQLFLCVADALHAVGWRIRSEPSRQDRVVALSETLHELIVGDWKTFCRHRVAPREPVVFFRIHKWAIHVPENSAKHSDILARGSNQKTYGVNKNLLSILIRRLVPSVIHSRISCQGSTVR